MLLLPPAAPWPAEGQEWPAPSNCTGTPAPSGLQQANVEARRARITAAAGPALYLTKLFGSKEAVVPLITALLVLVLDPLAVLLTLAATRR